MEGLKLRADWYKRNYNTVSSWLRKYREEWLGHYDELPCKYHKQMTAKDQC
jgi:hypothetical protein